MLGFKSFETAVKTIEGIETMHMIKKGQVKLKNIIGDQFSNGPHKVSIQINGNKSPESKDTSVEIIGFVSNQIL
jgi:hypothetical protein